MPKTDAYETELLADFEKGMLKSIATKSELAKFKAVARATAIKDRRVNIRLSSGDLQDIQVKALEEGLPYQTLIASVLHKYVTGRLAERESGSKGLVPQRKPQPPRASKTDLSE
jgi:predicted DNA binding CopG/RHH family protein